MVTGTNDKCIYKCIKEVFIHCCHKRYNDKCINGDRFGKVWKASDGY